MRLDFSLDTLGTCVVQLRDELLPLMELAGSLSVVSKIKK